MVHAPVFDLGSFVIEDIFKTSQPQEALHIKISDPTYPGGRCLLKDQISCYGVPRLGRWSVGDIIIFGLAIRTKDVLY